MKQNWLSRRAKQNKNKNKNKKKKKEGGMVQDLIEHRTQFKKS